MKIEGIPTNREDVSEDALKEKMAFINEETLRLQNEKEVLSAKVNNIMQEFDGIDGDIVKIMRDNKLKPAQERLSSIEGELRLLSFEKEEAERKIRSILN